MNSKILVLLMMVLASSAFAKNDTCAVVEAFAKQSVACGSREAELFLKPQETILGIGLSLFDSKRGMERDLEIRGISIKAADLASGAYLKNKVIQREIKKVEKDWGTTAKIELRAVELGKAAHFYGSQDFKEEIKTILNVEKRSLASTSFSEAQHSGVMRAKTKEAKK